MMKIDYKRRERAGFFTLAGGNGGGGADHDPPAGGSMRKGATDAPILRPGSSGGIRPLLPTFCSYRLFEQAERGGYAGSGVAIWSQGEALQAGTQPPMLARTEKKRAAAALSVCRFSCPDCLCFPHPIRV